jgi:hypothetical protein
MAWVQRRNFSFGVRIQTGPTIAIAAGSSSVDLREPHRDHTAWEAMGVPFGSPDPFPNGPGATQRGPTVISV